jgi:transcriptional regulator with XRE-family HTH domain
MIKSQLNISEKIKQVRKKEMLTQEDFAKSLGLNTSYISKLESGKNEPSEQLILSICRTYSVNHDWLTKDEGAMYNPPQKVTKKAPGGFDLNLMKEVIEAVEEVFQKNKLSLPPKKKAELIGFVYEEIAENEEIKGSIPGRVLKLIKLAS